MQDYCISMLTRYKLAAQLSQYALERLILFSYLFTLNDSPELLAKAESLVSYGQAV